MKKLHLSDDFALPFEAVTQTFAYLAKRGSGKTYTVAVLMEEMVGAGLPVVALDPVGVLWGLRAAADGKGPGLPVVIFGGDHGDVPLEPGAGAVVADFLIGARQPAVLDLSLFRKGEQAHFVTDFTEQLYRKNREPMHVVLDEADMFAPQRPMPGEQRMLGALEDLVRRGRARGLGVTLITQRPAVLHKDVLTQVEVLVCLRLIAPQDRAAVDAWVKVHGTPEQRDELMASLPSLPIGTAWFWSPGWLNVFRRVEIRRRRTFDSSATPTMGKRVATPAVLAPVDIDELRTRIASTIEKAKADDPKLLRKRIAELETALGKKESLPLPAKVVYQPVFDEADFARLKASIETDLEKMREAMQLTASNLRGAFHTYRSQIDEQSKKGSGAVASPPGRAPKQPLNASGDGSKPHAAARLNGSVTGRRDGPRTGDDEALGAGERAILTAIAQHGSRGVTREQLTVLTGYKRSSRDTYLQRLRAAELIVLAVDDFFIATTLGMARLGDDFEPLPTGTALRNHWLKKLPEGERRMLEVLVDAYPKAVPRDFLSDKTGYKRSSRDTYLQRLGARRLIEVSGGEVGAAAELFE